MPLPIGELHKFPPIALGDVAQVAAHVLTGKGKKGFNDKHRGQLMVLTGLLPHLLHLLHFVADTSILRTKVDVWYRAGRRCKRGTGSEA